MSDVDAALKRRSERQDTACDDSVTRAVQSMQAAYDARRAQREQRELNCLMMQLAREADVAGVYRSVGYLAPLLRAIQ